MTFLNPALLFGLAALIVPPIVHLLNRRRFEVVDWAAMQFLQISRKTRQRMVLEQIVLMLLRMGLIAVLVMALAAPVIDLRCVARLPGGQRLARLAGHADRDVVLIIDGSYSMSYRWNDKTAHDEARAWAGKFLDELAPGDRVAILQAKQRTIPVVGILTGDRAEVRSKLDTMPKPRGGIELFRSVQEACTILQAGFNPTKEIVILTDGQRQGFADPNALNRWEQLAQNLPTGTAMPRIWVVNVVPERPGDAPNWLVAPIESNRAVATIGRDVKFKFELQVPREAPAEATDQQTTSELPLPPAKVSFEVDGLPAGEKRPPQLRAPSIGMEFSQKFSTPGSHLLTAIIGDDALLDDNRRDFAVEVLPTIPVLVVDGDSRAPSTPSGSYFLRLALAPEGDAQPSFQIRRVTIGEFSSQLLTNPIGRDAGSIPRILVLADVPELSSEHCKAIEDYLKNGGGVLVTVGPRCRAESYNEHAYLDGHGWLPARLLEPKGDENAIDKAAIPLLETNVRDGHPALQLLMSEKKEGFLGAYFPRYWRLDASTGAASAIAKLSTGDPLFVERQFGKGRVLMSAVPLDNSWRTNLTRLGDFILLCHEFAYYLASARSKEANLAPGEAIVFRPSDGEPPGGVTIDLPEGPRRRIEVSSWPLVFGDNGEAREAGVYKLTTDSGRVQYFVVQPDTNESNLTPCGEADRKAVQAKFPNTQIYYETDVAKMMEAIRKSQNNPELWWLFLLLVIALLTAELAFTRYLAKKSPPVVE
jgi:hypothetical protein